MQLCPCVFEIAAIISEWLSLYEEDASEMEHNTHEIVQYFFVREISSHATNHDFYYCYNK